MAFQCEVGTWTPAAGTGNKTKTGLGFQPKALILWWDGGTADGYNIHVTNGLGWASSSATTDQSAIFWDANDGGSTTLTARAHYDGIIASSSTLGAGSMDVLARLVSFDAAGWTINFSSQTVNQRYGYLALGGSDLTNVKVGRFASPGATGNQDVTDPGFTPDCVLFMGASLATLTTTTSIADATITLGAGLSSAARWAVAGNMHSGQTMTAGVDAMTHQRTDACLLGLTNAAAIDFQADYVGGIANGFQINWSDLPGTASLLFGYLALQGGQYAVGASAKPTGAATANQDVTVGFAPVGLFLQSWGNAASTTITADFDLALGFSDGTNENTAWSQELDVTLPTEANHRSVATKALTKSQGPSTTQAECDSDFVSVANGFRLAWTTNDAVASEICYVALGSAAAATGIPPGLGPVVGEQAPLLSADMVALYA
jgi:hypothetical protein